jgi:hypothetical protein
MVRIHLADVLLEYMGDSVLSLNIRPQGLAGMMIDLHTRENLKACLHHAYVHPACPCKQRYRLEFPPLLH